MSEIQHTVIEMNNTIVGHTNKFTRAKEKISKLKDASVKKLSKLKCKEKEEKKETEQSIKNSTIISENITYI